MPSNKQLNTYNMLKSMGYGKNLSKNITIGKQIRLMQNEQFKATNGKFGVAPPKPKQFKTLDEKLNALTAKWKKEQVRPEHPEVTQARKDWELHDGRGDQNYWEERFVAILKKHRYPN